MASVIDSFAALRRFDQALGIFIIGMEKGLTLLQKNIAQEFLEGVVYKTPVDTGEARGGWFITVGQPSEAQTNILDKSGHETIANGIIALFIVPPYSRVFIQNNVGHIKYLEYGTDKMPAFAMVARTSAEIVAKYRNVPETAGVFN